jgi:hypothetical protein
MSYHFTVEVNVLQLQEVGDFGDENCLRPLNLIRSTKLHLTTEPPISCRVTPRGSTGHKATENGLDLYS